MFDKFESLPTTSSYEVVLELAENVIEDFLMSMAKKGYIATTFASHGALSGLFKNSLLRKPPSCSPARCCDE